MLLEIQDIACTLYITCRLEDYQLQTIVISATLNTTCATDTSTITTKSTRSLGTASRVGI